MGGMTEFKEEPQGVLVSMDASEPAGLSYVVWFPYTRKYITLVREGDLVAVRSFANSDGKDIFLFFLHDLCKFHFQQHYLDQ